MTKITKDIIYQPNDDLKLDLFETKSENKKKVSIILIHGGGWFHGSKDSETQLAMRLLEDGYDVVVPDYRLAPPNFYPAPLEDLDQVYDWTKENLAQNKITSIGTSVGGTMAVELAIKYGIPAVSLSGIFDIEKWIKKHQEVKPSLHFNKSVDELEQNQYNESFYKGFVMNYLDDDESLLKAVTPYFRIGESTGPICLFNSLNELAPVSGVIKVEKSLIKNKIPCWVQFLSGSGHGNDYALKVIDRCESFIDEFV